MFITFEGIEGSGKSTHIKMVEQSLKEAGHDVVVTREPGGSELGMRLRGILLDPDTGDLWPLTELLLFSAARSELLVHVIKPALAEGKIVLCDRFADSTLAYQGYGRGLDIDLVSGINQTVCKGLWPDLTIWLDLPLEVGLGRAMKRLETDGSNERRFEEESILFHTHVCEGFKSIATNDPGRVKRVDANCSIDEVAFKIMECINEAIA